MLSRLVRFMPSRSREGFRDFPQSSPHARGSSGSGGTLVGIGPAMQDCREEFAVGMECPGGCRALLRGEGLPNAEPREREPAGGHHGAEPLGGGALLLRDWLLDFTLSATR